MNQKEMNLKERLFSNQALDKILHALGITLEQAILVHILILNSEHSLFPGTKEIFQKVFDELDLIEK